MPLRRSLISKLVTCRQYICLLFTRHSLAIADVYIVLSYGIVSPIVHTSFQRTLRSNWLYERSIANRRVKRVDLVLTRVVTEYTKKYILDR